MNPFFANARLILAILYVFQGPEAALYSFRGANTVAICGIVHVSGTDCGKNGSGCDS